MTEFAIDDPVIIARGPDHDDAVGATSRPPLRSMLRSATRVEHDGVDRSFGSFDLDDATSYRAFLRIHRDALTILADRWGPDARDDVDALLACLDRDLSGPARSAVDRPGRSAHRSRFEQAGIAYVVRGSRMGAAFLLKRVGAGFPVAYLSYRPAVTWTRFLADLEALDAVADTHARGEVLSAAREAFSVFADAATSPGAT